MSSTCWAIPLVIANWLPTDVTISGWDSVLEQAVEDGRPIVRLGLSLLRGMRDGSTERIETARAVRQFKTVSDLAQRAQLDRHDLQVLAAANALSALAGNRRFTTWVPLVLFSLLTRPTRAALRPEPWQCEGEVRHLVAQRLVDMSHLPGGLATVSRDFC